MIVRPLLLALCLLIGVALDRTALAAEASYFLPDGSIYIVAEKPLEPVLARVNELYARRHPDTRFTVLFGERPVGIDGIVARVSLFAPIAHDPWEGEIEPFRRLNGYAPLDVRIGRVGHSGPGRANPPAVYVNAANPLARLSLEDVGRIFTTGLSPSDLRHWRQIGVGGEWEKVGAK